MPHLRRRFRLWLWAGVLGTALPAAAQAEQVSFDVYMLGLRAGTLSYAMARDSGRYALTGQVRSTGIVSVVARYRVDAQATGRLTDDGFRPERYSEKTLENDTPIERSISYSRSGTPTLTSEEKPRPYWVPPAKQAGTLDPMTTIYELLRDRPGGNPCVLDATFGDGARVGRVTTKRVSASQSEATCRGQYERGGGFSEKELRQGKVFPFTLSYKKDGDLWRVTGMDIESSRGRAKLVRR